MKLRLNSFESEYLVNDGVVIVERNGKRIIIEKNEDYDGGYSINIINPYDKVIFDTKDGE